MEQRFKLKEIERVISKIRSTMYYGVVWKLPQESFLKISLTQTREEESFLCFSIYSKAKRFKR